MSIDREPTSARPPRRHPAVAALRSILFVRLPPNDTRLIDFLRIVVAIPVAFIVCLPIVVLTVLAGIPIGFLLTELEASESIVGIYGLGVFGVGLALSFAVLVKLSRRLPSKVRTFLYENDELEPASTPILRRDPNADDGTLHARLAAADAALALDVAGADPGDASPTSDRPPD